ncbi:hypothetical protein BT93_L1280 [Corymbia citriodora subsp. variegata]|uniref:Secreted protein n=1 Tax=Corymbia citriodora subsp. variegata TaxID=360336 RepID=A0A8T0CPC9_CORYI|nr:hypothetical protein BT93_L1280 [Corymbia citriodora subsp. variegata]
MQFRRQRAMEKFCAKSIVLLVLLIFALGWGTSVEARDVTHPCRTVRDCGDPRFCRCPTPLHLCICYYPPLGVGRGSPIYSITPESQQEDPIEPIIP